MQTDGLRNFIDLYMQWVIILIHNCGMKASSLMWMGKKMIYECMDQMLSYEERLKADIQLDSYDQAKLIQEN